MQSSAWLNVLCKLCLCFIAFSCVRCLWHYSLSVQFMHFFFNSVFPVTARVNVWGYCAELYQYFICSVTSLHHFPVGDMFFVCSCLFQLGDFSALFVSCYSCAFQEDMWGVYFVSLKQCVYSIGMRLKLRWSIFLLHFYYHLSTKIKLQENIVPEPSKILHHSNPRLH